MELSVMQLVVSTIKISSRRERFLISSTTKRCEITELPNPTYMFTFCLLDCTFNILGCATPRRIFNLLRAVFGIHEYEA